MRRRGTPHRRLLRLVPVSASQGEGRGVPTPLPLLGLALPHCCALGFDRTQCGYSVSTPTARTLNPKNPKIDSGVTDVMDSPPHAMRREAASSPALARSCLGLAGGGEGGSRPPLPPARPRATAFVNRPNAYFNVYKYLNPKITNIIIIKEVQIEKIEKFGVLSKPQINIL